MLRRIRAALAAFWHPELVGATKDPLTGILNRQGFVYAAERELARAQRNSHPLTLLFIDLDGLKRINDTQGHLMGDSHLRRFSRIIKGSIRPYDVFARWGGDEFVLLLPGVDLTGSKGVVSRIRDLSHDLGFSWGASYWIKGDNLNSLFGRADREMYEMKMERRRGATTER